jgi:carbonic anhydrase/acetyltransferase-like protein (isoleucine patch superfamily)
MPMQSYQRFIPSVHALAYIHSSAVLIGEIDIGEEASVWPMCVLRGDNGAIRIGARTNLQDGSICHATLGVSKTTIGVECTVGHRVTLHGCTVGNQCLVGMGSTLLDGVVLGDDCFVAAGSLLTPNKVFEPRSFIIGSPAKRVREVKASELAAIKHGWKTYLDLTRTYRAASPL